MKLGIMQPYLFPYIGYFQLISAVDEFIIYDDVAFMKQSWINRNRVLLHGQPHLFSVPLRGASSYQTIRKTTICEAGYPRWKEKFLKTIHVAYNKAPFYEATRKLLADVLNETPANIGDLASKSIFTVCKSLSLSTRIEPTSTIYENSDLAAQERVLDICAKKGAAMYINSPGGRHLYSAESFRGSNVKLRFLATRMPDYLQFDGTFVPGLSILDVLMFNSIQEIQKMLPEYTLQE